MTIPVDEAPTWITLLARCRIVRLALHSYRMSTWTRAEIGALGEQLAVEQLASLGLRVHIVGLPDTALQNSRDRVRPPHQLRQLVADGAADARNVGRHTVEYGLRLRHAKRSSATVLSRTPIDM